MSITITTDVFCDGCGCARWEHGVCGPRPDARRARQQARRAGWRRLAGRDLCPECAGNEKAKGRRK